MSVRHYKNKRERRHLRVRGKVRGTAARPRLSVFRSNRHIYAQLIDDEKGETLVACNTKTLNGRKRPTQKHGDSPRLSVPERSEGFRVSVLQGKVKTAYEVGQVLAKKALKKGIKKAVFDRGGYKYHGRVKALAEGARAGGLEF